MLVNREKNPYAVTLHNVDQFELLTEASKIKRADGSEKVRPSEMYLKNLSLSFEFGKIAQSLTTLSNNRASRNLRKEDNTVLFARMQN